MVLVAPLDVYPWRNMELPSRKRGEESIFHFVPDYRWSTWRVYDMVQDLYGHFDV